MERYSKKTDEFIKNYVLPKLGFLDYDDENISDIYEFMFDIEGDLCEKEERGKKLSNEESWLLDNVTSAITEITGREDW